MFLFFPRRSTIALSIALVLYLILGLGFIQNMGVVGEVAWTWMKGHADTNPYADLPSHTWGPLTAASTRPMESLSIGNFDLPLTVNAYTSAIADWPARALAGLGANYDTTMFIHFLLGGLFIFLFHRFIRIHGSGIAASAATIILSTDWVFVFFRRTLGGTELLLQAALLLCIWAFWSRRWAGGRHGLWAFALGVGIGLSAKLTFILSLLPLMAAAFLLRTDVGFS